MEFKMRNKVIALLTVLGISLAAISPASAWYRGGWGGYYGGWGPGAAIGAGIAGAIVGGAIVAGSRPYYGGYYGGYYPAYGYYAAPAPTYYYPQTYYGW
jgi:hypothetical protein